MYVALLLCLLPLVQGTIIMSIATIDSNHTSPYELNQVDTQTGENKQIVQLPEVPYHNCAVFRQHDNTVVYCSEDEHWLATVDISTGKVRQGEDSPYSPMHLGYDKGTYRTFAFATLSSDYQIYLLELLPNQTLQKLVVLPQAFVHGTSTYSSSKQVFFLNMNNLLAVSTAKGQEGKVLYSIPLVEPMRALVYDDTSDVLYGWFYEPSTQSVTLVSLDYPTGKILKTFFQSSTHSFLDTVPMCIDKTGSTIYTLLFDGITNYHVIHSVEVSSGKSSEVHDVRFVKTLICQ